MAKGKRISRLPKVFHAPKANNHPILREEVSQDIKPGSVQRSDLAIHVETRIQKTLVNDKLEDVSCLASGSDSDHGNLYKAIRIESSILIKGEEDVLSKTPDARLLEDMILDFLKKKLLPKKKVI